VIFKVFGGNDSAKTTTEPPTLYNNNNDPGRLPPRVDPFSNIWKNHHNNDDASRSSDSTNIDNDHFYKPNESANNKNHNINNGYPSTQRPFYINRDNSNLSINSGGNNINKPTKKTSKFKILILIIGMMTTTTNE
jgi:hypothetical protein